MALNLSLPQDPFDIRPRITVIGVGGAGGNAVNNMIRSQLEGVEFLIANTDAQALQGSMCERRIQLGQSTTKGLGAGARPDVGRGAAEQAGREILHRQARGRPKPQLVRRAACLAQRGWRVERDQAATIEAALPAELDLEQIWNLTDDLLAAHGDWIPAWARPAKKQRVA